MRFEDAIYQDLYLDYQKESANGTSKKNLVKRIFEGGKSFVINCNPFIGYLTVNQQQELRDKSPAFSSLNTETAVLASAIGLGLGAYFVGQYLNGFDIGIDIMEKTIIGGWGGTAVEIPKYTSFPFIWGGFPKAFSQIASYYLMAESAIRTGAALLGKPLGCLITEGFSYLIGKKAKHSKFMKQKEMEIEQEKRKISESEIFMEKERKEKERKISDLSWNIIQSNNKEKRSELESLIGGLENGE